MVNCAEGWLQLDRGGVQALASVLQAWLKAAYVDPFETIRGLNEQDDVLRAQLNDCKENLRPAWRGALDAVKGEMKLRAEIAQERNSLLEEVKQLRESDKLLRAQVDARAEQGNAADELLAVRDEELKNARHEMVLLREVYEAQQKYDKVSNFSVVDRAYEDALDKLKRARRAVECLGYPCNDCPYDRSCELDVGGCMRKRGR
jgi:septal ring factor EnvC (AmiA/AmiB activator)